MLVQCVSVVKQKWSCGEENDTEKEHMKKLFD